MKLFARPCVVVWRDANSSAGWKDDDDVADRETVQVMSFGVVVRRTRKILVLAHGVSEDGEYLGLTTIPTPWVVKVLYPRLGTKKPKKGNADGQK